MKKYVVILAAACLAVACTSKETPEVLSSKVFNASIEPETKTYTEAKKVYWYAGDAVSIFDKGNTENDNVKYTYAGEDGTTRGPLTTQNLVVASNSLQYTYGIYPYYSDNLVLSEGKAVAYIDPEQDYEVDSFGDGANAMVAVSADNRTLEFKNVAGYLKLRLYGDNSTPIQAIQVASNNEEYISGDVLVEMLPGQTPVLSAYPDNNYASDVAIVYFPEDPAITLNPSQSSPLDVWVALTPGTIASGITVSVLGADNRLFTYENTKPLTIKRGICTSTAPLKVEFPELVEDPETKAAIEENVAGDYIFNITAGYDGQVYDNSITMSYSLKANSNVHLEGDFIDCSLSADATFDRTTGLLTIPQGVACLLVPAQNPKYYGSLYYGEEGDDDMINIYNNLPVTFKLTAPHTFISESPYSIYIAVAINGQNRVWDWTESINSITYQSGATINPGNPTKPVRRKDVSVRKRPVVPVAWKSLDTTAPLSIGMKAGKAF